jgi:hypothetical protein
MYNVLMDHGIDSRQRLEVDSPLPPKRSPMLKGASIGSCDSELRERTCLSEVDLNARRAIRIHT